MNALIRGIILTVLLVVLGATCVLAVDPPHDPTSGITCANCHYAGSVINSVGFTNFCNTCHRPGGMAQLHPFSPNDASNIFNNVTSQRTGVIMQHSHNWAGGLDVPRAGAATPAATSPLSYTPLIGLSCDRCHSIHGPLQSATNSFPLLRMLKDQDQICFECHGQRKTTNQTTGSHPVTMTYTTAIKKFARYTTKFYTTPVNANPANSSSAIRLNGGLLICSSCHGMHFADSSSATFDNASSVILGRLVPGDGFLLRTDMRGATANTTNICTNCHKGKLAHNVKQQNIQCADCHAGHVDEADGTTPNVWLVRRYMTYSTGTYKLNNRALGKPTFFQSTTVKNYRDANGTGVCQSCHATLPTTVAEHSQPVVNCNSCHYHDNPKGSFAAEGCNGCHGQPPSVSTTGGPNGSAAGYTRANEATTPHLSHVGGTGSYNYTCIDCHKGNSHASGSFSDVFLSPAGTLAASNGATPTYNVAGLTCATTYCHSNGAPRGGSLVTVTPGWANGKGTIIGTANECAACHGSATTLATNAHMKHVNATTGKGYACEACHGSVVTGSSAIKDKSRHVDGFKNISFARNSVAMVAGASWNSSAATCATACHSNGKGALVTPSWTAAATGACGTCHAATAPLIGTNAHPAHFTAAYGPLFTAAATSCASCHTYTTETAATHVNGSVDTPAANCTTSCHKNGINTSTNWVAGRVTCESCHSGSLSVIGGVTAPDKTLNTTAGHGQATYTGTPQCSSCHNANASHITGTLGVNMRLILPDDNSQCASCHNVAGKVKSAFANMSTHFTVKGGSQDMLCKQCHDPHGSSNLSMVRTQLKGAWTNATTYTIAYTNTATGLVNSSTNRGLCQVCHTKTNHYRAGSAEVDHPTSGCLDCHSHRAAGGAFKPSGGCNGCHGYPPAPRNVANLTFGTAGNYVNAAYENYSGGGGAHMIPGHLATTVTAAQGWVNCTPCHNSGSVAHRALTPINTHIANVTVTLDPKLKFNATKQMSYSGARLVYPGNRTGQCSNVECHFQASPKWSLTATGAAAPTITSVTPASMVQGTTAQTVTLVGTNLTGGTLSVSGTGVTLGGTTVSATQITAPVTVTAAAATGARTLTVTTVAGSATATFTVTAAVTPAPTVSSVSPSSIVSGTAASVTITGTNLSGASVAYSRGSVGTATTATATQIIIPITGTSVGAGTVTVTTAGGSATGALTVTAAAPTVSSISPTSIVSGAVTSVTITGTNLSGATVTFGNGSVGAATTATATQIIVPITGTTVGAGTVTVSTAGGSTTGTLTVTAAPTPAPTVSSVSPTSIVSGVATSVTITGTNLSGASVTFGNGSVGTATTATATQLILPITGTTVGAGTVTVTTAGGSATGTLTVTAAAPTISSISPTSIVSGVATSVTITGANLSGATVAYGNGTVGTATTATATQIIVPITGTVVGTGTVTVTTAGGSATTTLTVTAAATRVNVALQANGGVASASSTYNATTYPIASLNNGDHIGKTWGTGGGWNDATNNVYPDWAQITFSAAKTIDEIDVYTVQDALTASVEPTATMTFTKYGITAFDVQYWDGTAWVTVPTVGSITGNNLVWRKITLPTVITTDRIRVQVNASIGGYSRIVEIEAYGY